MNVSRTQNAFTAVAFALFVMVGSAAVAQDSMTPATMTPATDAMTMTTGTGMMAANATDKKDIVETAMASDDCSTLVKAIKAADLVDTLKGEGPFTVFAPTNAAFAKLPEGALEDLLKPENKEKLKSILTYHVVSGKVDAAAVSKMTSAETVNGEELTIKADDGTVSINNAKVTKADIMVSNGVIHKIDTVLMPK